MHAVLGLGCGCGGFLDGRGQIFPLRSNGLVCFANGPLHDVVTADDGRQEVNESHATLSPFGQGHPHAIVNVFLEAFVIVVEALEPTFGVVGGGGSHGCSLWCGVVWYGMILFDKEQQAKEVPCVVVV